MYDVVIIGAGVIGCAAARYLSRYQVKACVVERCGDVCEGTSKANSAIVHAGYDAAHGSLMAEMNVRGSRMMPELAKELDFDYDQIGSLVVCMSEEERPKLTKLYENGLANGVEGLELIDAERLREMEPNISPDAVSALWAPTGAIVCPFGLTIALAENAYQNGVEFRLDTEVKGLTRSVDHWAVQTDSGVLDAKCVVNAAGVYADVFHNMVSAEKLRITPRRGDYCLLDRSVGGFARHTIFQLPGKYGKGVLISPTVHGNVIIGPTAIDIEDREGTNTTAEGLSAVLAQTARVMPGLPSRQVITSFAGLRAHEDAHEFRIGEVPDAPGFFDCAGIESPGLSSAPAIGERISALLAEKLSLREDPSFVPSRKGMTRPKKLSREEYNALIAKDPAYGQIVCRCETVTEGEIIESIRRPLGARSLDGVKRRTRAGMGRCQAGFCSPRVIEILARELGIPQSAVTKCGGKSRVIVGRTGEDD